MKKSLLFIGVLVFSWMGLFAQSYGQYGYSYQVSRKPNVQINCGLDFGGVMKEKINYESTSEIDTYSTKPTTKVGISPSVEVCWPLNPQMYLGGGLEYQLHRGFIEDDGGSIKFNFIPMYVIGKYQFAPNSNATPEAIIHLGYNFYSGSDGYTENAELSGGICWAVGAGLSLNKKYILQLLYKQENGTWKNEYYNGGTGFYRNIKSKDAYSHATATIGYRFN